MPQHTEEGYAEIRVCPGVCIYYAHAFAILPNLSSSSFIVVFFCSDRSAGVFVCFFFAVSFRTIVIILCALQRHLRSVFESVTQRDKNKMRYKCGECASFDIVAYIRDRKNRSRHSSHTYAWPHSKRTRSFLLTVMPAIACASQFVFVWLF